MEHNPKWLKPVATIVSLLIMALLIAGVLMVPYTAMQAPSGYDQSRLHWNTKNTTRFWGSDLNEVASQVSRAVYPATQAENTPDIVLLYDPQDWQSALQASSLLRSLNAVLLPAVAGIDAEIERLQPRGSQQFDGVQVVALNSAEISVDGFETATLTINDVMERARDMGPLRAILVDRDDPQTALLAAPWAAYSGDLIIFDEADAPDRMPVIGLGEVDIDGNITGRDAAHLSVTFAAYQNDDYPGFGWGMNNNTLTGYRAYTLANIDNPAMALLSANLARRGKIAPLLWAEQDRLPTVVNNYIWTQRAAFWNTPSEGPFHHFWVLGNLDEISFPAQSQADYAVEIGPYKEKGYGMGGTDMLGAIWVALGLASAGWIATHSSKFLPFENWAMRLAWILFGLMMGPFGIPIYYLAHNRPIIKMKKMIMWDRPLWLQGIVATVSAVGFGASIMIASGYITTFFGLPLLPNHTPFFWLGTPMIIVMIINYVSAVVISWLLFQTPMLAMFYGLPYRETLFKALPMVLISMTAAALAMNPAMWWLMMWNLPMMPTEESILWFGVMFFTAFLAFLMAIYPNYLLVRLQRKGGLM